MVAFIILIPRILILQTNDNIASPASSGNVEQLGILLFTKYLLPFEIAAVMLLIAMIAGIILVKKDSQGLRDTNLNSKENL